MRSLRHGSVLLGAFTAALLSGCYMRVVPLAKDDASVSDVASAQDAGMTPSEDAPAAPDVPLDPPRGAGSVDLLLVMDNSASMRASQDYVNERLSIVLGDLIERHGVRDVRVGVVTSDLGTPGANVPQCRAPDTGDDGLLNPRVRGPASALTTLPMAPAPVFCERLPALPYIALRSSDDAMLRYWATSCHGTVGTSGCGLEQPLEAARRALVEHGRGANAGFLRSEATLAILVVSDEEDGSVRDCRRHDGVGPCDDATDVFQAASTRWASPDLNLRFYDYDPGSAQDPTWPIERYVDPARPTRGLLGLKPGHPERVVFGAITGVPVALPQRADGSTDWDALLGPHAPGRPDDFNARIARGAVQNLSDPSGPTSMRSRDRDPECPARMLPACRVPGPHPTPSCTISEQRFAWRARRIAEVARRMDESVLCAGAPCRNGMVASICDEGDTSPFTRFAAMIARRVVR